MGEVDPSFCPALVLSNSDRTAPDLGMVAALQVSRWKRVTRRGERSWGGRGDVCEGGEGGGGEGCDIWRRWRVDHQHHFVEAVSHIPTIIAAFKADLDSNNGFTTCTSCNHGNLHVQA